MEQDEIRRVKEGADLVALFEQHTQVERAGRHHRAWCPFHSEETPSCQIYEDGHFHCYGCGAHGDAIDFIQMKDGASFEEAVAALGGMPQAPKERRPKRDKRKKWLPMCPVPKRAAALRANLKHFAYGVPVQQWPYLDRKGQLLCIDARYEYEKAGKPKKAVLTCTWCQHAETGEQAWRVGTPLMDPHPLYGLDTIADDCSEIVVAEGCKAAQAAHQRLGLPSLTWRGGCQNLTDGKHDWSPVRGKRLIIWPDADWDRVMCECKNAVRIPPETDVRAVQCDNCGRVPTGDRVNLGMEAARAVARFGLAAGAESARIVDVSEYRLVKDGWDLADAHD